MQNYIHFVIGALLLVVGLNVSSHATAAQSIVVNGGVITVERGHINPQDFTGKASGVIFTAENSEVIVIDEYEAIKGDQSTIEIIKLTGIQIITDDGLFLLDQFKAHDLIITPTMFSAKNLNLFIDQQNHLKIEEVLFEAAGNTAPQISENMPQDVRVMFNSIKYTPHPSDTKTKNMLNEALGVEKIDADISINANGNALDDRLDIYTAFNLNLEDVGAINFAIDIGMFYDGLAKLFSQSLFASGNDYDAITETLLDTLVLNGALLQVDDAGMVGVGLNNFAQEQGISRDDAVPYIMAMLAGIGADAAPNIYSALQQPLQNFLEQGGQFSINLDPAEPAPASTLFMLMMLPDMAVATLGLTITHQP